MSQNQDTLTNIPLLTQCSAHEANRAIPTSTKSDKDWTKVPDRAERKRIQHRISQRNYREKLKKYPQTLERRIVPSEGFISKSQTPIIQYNLVTKRISRSGIPRPQAASQNPTKPPQFPLQIGPDDVIPLHDHQAPPYITNTLNSLDKTSTVTSELDSLPSMIHFTSPHMKKSINPHPDLWNSSQPRNDTAVHNFFYSNGSLPFSSVSTRITTPSQSPPPLVQQHGPILLSRIRSQGQYVDFQPDQDKASSTPGTRSQHKDPSSYTHTQSFTNPGLLNDFFHEDENSLFQLSLYPPAVSPQEDTSRSILDEYGIPTLYQMSSDGTAMSRDAYNQSISPYQNLVPYDLPHSLSLISNVAPPTTLMNYLTTSNPTPPLVRVVSFPVRDPNVKHFWWDVRQVRPWSSFNLNTILALPGASVLLEYPVPKRLLQQPTTNEVRYPETEAALHSLYASYYVPKLNTALAVSSQRPLQFSVSFPKSSCSIPADHHGFIVNLVGNESFSIASKFRGKPTARIIGLVKSFDRFNTGMRLEDNIKRVEYLRGLAHLHHMMREHSTRYGFILTEIELIVVRNGTHSKPHFGYLEVASVQLAAAADARGGNGEIPFTACLALWGLCMMVGDEPTLGQAPWKAEVGVPADGSRSKAMLRDTWMPQPQILEKRQAKRARGWVFPEDPVTRKELDRKGTAAVMGFKG